jgi:hypothetical protein
LRNELRLEKVEGFLGRLETKNILDEVLRAVQHTIPNGINPTVQVVNYKSFYSTFR